MRELMKSMFRFSWAMSLFGASSVVNLIAPQEPRQPKGKTAFGLDAVAYVAEQQMGDQLKAIFETGDKLQSGMVDLMFGALSAEKTETASARMQAMSGQAGQHAAHRTSSSAPGQVSYGGLNRSIQNMSKDSPVTVSVQLSNTTQGPFWPPSEIMDKDGNFIVIGGFILKEVTPGKITPVPNEQGVIVSKDTVPPLQNGKEDFSNPFGASYQIVRELDLSPGGRDWELIPYSLSCGPFVGDFGGGQPRIPGAGDSTYNLNSNPRWNAWIAPIGADSPTYYRPSYPLHQVPIWRLADIPEYIPTGVPVDPGTPGRRSSAGGTDADFRRRWPITLRQYLQGRGALQITLLRASGAAGGFTHARFDFAFEALLPNAIYAIWALRPVTLLPPTDPHFLLPVPLALPNIAVTDSQGNAAVSYEVRHPFPDPAKDARGTRIIAVAVTYLSDFQNWGAALTSIGTGANAHTAMSGSLSGLTDLITVESSG
jgi:hypothetical protein